MSVLPFFAHHPDRWRVLEAVTPDPVAPAETSCGLCGGQRVRNTGARRPH